MPQVFETADSQNRAGKQRFAVQMSAGNRGQAERQAHQLGRDRFGTDYQLDTEPVPDNALLHRFVVVCGDQRLPVEAPTWW
ncbi:MAG: hypothetical protein HY565_01060 [Candidatus Kerfeldbacteria bacterium]|nr:hypothetical protein [Candidatus Kerfeldbacteria bacterium]